MAQYGGVSAEQLQAFVERIERLEEEKAALAADIREIYAEAKAFGFDPKTLRQVVRLRKMEESDRVEQEMLLATYLGALGMLADTPLGQAAVRNLEKAAGTQTDIEELAPGGPGAAARAAAKEFVDVVRKSGSTVTLEAGGRSVTIGASA